MKPDPAPRPRQPLLHQASMVVAGIVEKDVDQAFAGIHQRVNRSGSGSDDWTLIDEVAA
jgi:hypothetical protein